MLFMVMMMPMVFLFGLLGLLFFFALLRFGTRRRRRWPFDFHRDILLLRLRGHRCSCIRQLLHWLQNGRSIILIILFITDVGLVVLLLHVIRLDFVVISQMQFRQGFMVEIIGAQEKGFFFLAIVQHKFGRGGHQRLVLLVLHFIYGNFFFGDLG